MWDQVESVWELCIPFVQKPLDRTIAGDLYTLDSILTSIKSREMQLWLVHESGTLVSVGITQILTYPKKKVLDILLAGGDRWEEWGETSLTLMGDYAREQGCESIRGYGRLGWVKKLKKRNIKPSLYFDMPIPEAPNAH